MFIGKKLADVAFGVFHIFCAKPGFLIKLFLKKRSRMCSIVQMNAYKQISVQNPYILSRVAPGPVCPSAKGRSGSLGAPCVSNFF